MEPSPPRALLGDRGPDGRRRWTRALIEGAQIWLVGTGFYQGRATARQPISAGKERRARREYYAGRRDAWREHVTQLEEWEREEIPSVRDELLEALDAGGDEFEVVAMSRDVAGRYGLSRETVLLIIDLIFAQRLEADPAGPAALAA